MAKQNKRNTANGTDAKMVRSLDDLQEFAEFQADILPLLRKAIKAGKSAEEIYTMVSSAAAGKLATLAIKEQDPMKALSLIKEVLDRSGGKAKERQEITSRYAEMPDAELDALLKSQEEDLDEHSEH